MSLDLTFLSERLTSTSAPPRPVNVYDILREGWRETRVDMTLQFFLDPNERHGLGTLVIDALLKTLDGASSIGPDGALEARLQAETASGSEAWEVETQVDFIDVYAVNRDLDIAIVLENKIGHVLHNPLKKYAAHARKEGFGTVIVGVLAPEVRAHQNRAQEKYLSRPITYTDLSDAITESNAFTLLDRAGSNQNQRRSLDLLDQFLEARTTDNTMANLHNEQERLDEWREINRKHEHAIAAFESARKEMRRMIRDRRQRLEPLIADRFESLGLQPDWEAHGGANDETWNAYHFPTADWSIELKFSLRPSMPAVFVYDRAGNTYTNTTSQDLGLDWLASDEELAEAFVTRVQAILTDALHGSRRN
ncbi:PD-(D/E)XK nuclease family protein [Microbacterium sp. YY-03]|uniref:PD-(D/E)XK nuclease family protein n=1 Tax=Microbacterium sp. YY-03 TaxID=3421636 RepID=UPI003D17BD73